uniref:Uncharacterized protein n=1 Tax=Hyaloperonospora arabidopsidis (strain Emoy2) TaxID=559515 RepID=M4BTC7_HYAAE
MHIVSTSLERAVGQGASLTSVARNLDGRAVVAATQDQSMRIVNLRTQHLVTCGSDAMSGSSSFGTLNTWPSVYIEKESMRKVVANCFHSTILM